MPCIMDTVGKELHSTDEFILHAGPFTGINGATHVDANNMMDLLALEISMIMVT